MARIFNSLKFIFKPKLSEEAFWAYYYRLPETIQVKWFRDGNYIIGEIYIDDKKYYTQGKDSEDFIAMVNDLAIAVCEIPKDYIEIIKNCRTYEPSPQEREKLENIRINRSMFGFRKKRKECLKYA